MLQTILNCAGDHVTLLYLRPWDDIDTFTLTVNVTIPATELRLDLLPRITLIRSKAYNSV